MLIFPAIDLFEGQAVRLYKGNYAEKTVYSSSPIRIAEDFRNCGVTHMHVVDLEGALTGQTPNAELIVRMKREVGLFMEVGGGIRDRKTIEKYLDQGIDRVILGTAAVEDESFLKEMVQSFSEKIAVSVDLKDGFAAVRGWTEKSAYSAEAFFQKLAEIGVKTVVCTDVSKDGAMAGTNRSLYQTLSDRFPIDLIASGGVSTIEDVKSLKAMGLYGAIIGKAYYTGAVNLREVLSI
ncbi:MAG: 1-(5-phosphoribosyl)-5-[Lachnospiraceae bacterium]|nr:1-(5-phosphoribosyl)-5-[(5-phosphoribosylamino)methylideneamino]imidazole-4-carboxamide isomerase [Lachnospiraceae bacterium]